MITASPEHGQRVIMNSVSNIHAGVIISKVKTYLRKAAARALDTVVTAMGEAWYGVTPKDIGGWFQDRCAYAMH
jgi:hypothetical protein